MLSATNYGVIVLCFDKSERILLNLQRTCRKHLLVICNYFMLCFYWQKWICHLRRKAIAQKPFPVLLDTKHVQCCRHLHIFLCACEGHVIFFNTWCIHSCILKWVTWNALICRWKIVIHGGIDGYSRLKSCYKQQGSNSAAKLPVCCTNIWCSL